MNSSLIKPVLMWPVRSSSAVVGKFWLPAWWRTALVGLVLSPALGAGFFFHGVPPWLDDGLVRTASAVLPAELAFEHIHESVFFAVAVAVFIMLAILLVGNIRYGRRGETAIYADRIELVLDDVRQTIHWNAIRSR